MALLWSITLVFAPACLCWLVIIKCAYYVAGLPLYALFYLIFTPAL